MPASKLLSQGIEYRTLPELVTDGSEALSRGFYPQAAQAFNAIVENYQEEPIWLEGQLPAQILPLAGFSSYKSQLHQQAIFALETYLDSYASTAENDSFVRYVLASSLLLDGQSDLARTKFAELREQAGETPLRDLAILQEARLSDASSAIPLLETLLESPASKRLESYARLQLISLQLEAENLTQAAALLLDKPWPLSEMAELATLSSLAAQAGDALLEALPAQALQAYQLVLPKGKLVSAQRARIERLQSQYQSIRPTLTTEQSIWSEQYRSALGSMQGQLENLASSEDYQDAIDLRKARCFARTGHPLEAWLLLEAIAIGESPLAREAHLDWIDNAQKMQAWNTSALIAQRFIELYPDDKRVPVTLFRIALAQIEQSHFGEAIASLQKVLSSQSENLTSPAFYYIGYSFYNLRKTTPAIASFRKCVEAAPNLPVAKQARLWIGICHFTSNNTKQAIATFREVQQDPSSGALYPEAAYREAAALFAQDELVSAEETLRRYLDSYPSHAREAEVRLLLGDVLTELRKESEAIKVYRSVETADPDLAYFASDKLALLLLQEGQKQQAREALIDYRQRVQIVPPAHIGSFTELLANCSEAPQAETEVARAISDYGNNPQAVGIVELLQILAELPKEDPKQPTLASRIRVAKIEVLRQHRLASQAKSLALSLVSDFSIESLGPAALLEAGKALSDIDSQETSSYLQRTLEVYPDSRYTDPALLALAQTFHKQGDPKLALAHLDQMLYQSADSLSLRLDLLVTLESLPAAKETGLELLSERTASPQQKAHALNSLGTIAEANGDLETAYSYHQRVFTLYRGESLEVANAYRKCIQILEKLNRASDAQKVAQEFLAATDLSNWPDYQSTMGSYRTDSP
ncbi:tetratricopeptide repeat protein [Pelagicoccus albus]|uniref:Tetratricopeptide repeat protein n=1 Tax=Pelagicoccus albus TaxID=415222 RepID=A0A7X1BA16_9BACT|nr:tetratricopeptide repeat protein [Pelagicoccus albus]